MNGKFLLKQIEQACIENRIDYQDLISLGLEIQQRQVEELCARNKQMCDQIKKDMKPSDPLDLVKIRQIGKIINLNWN